MKSLGFVCILISCVQFLNAGYYIGDYYVSHPLKLSWWKASRFCTFYGQDLIDIPDECEYRNILDIIQQVQERDPKFVDHVWTSGVRYNDDKWFYWETTGMPVMYADWVPGDPNLRDNENFIVLWHGRDFKLADELNNGRHTFICRKRGAPRELCEDTNTFNLTRSNNISINCNGQSDSRLIV